MVNNNPVQHMLCGENAFYKQQDYESALQKEMSTSKNLPAPVYRCQLENKVWRIVKIIFAALFWPFGLCLLLHSLGSLAVLPAVVINKTADLDRLRGYATQDFHWKYKRLRIEVDGCIIDATIMGKPETLGNGRWMLKSVGNGDSYENDLLSHECEQILSEIKGNAIFFNYPGVGASTGMPSRSAMAKAYRAMLNFLEDKEKGIGAKEIIGYGHSIGGGAQAEGIRDHAFKDDVHYVFVKDRTFSDLSTAAKHMSKPLGFLSTLFGWNIDCVASSQNLQQPEIIIQTAETGSRDPFGWSQKPAIDLAKEPEKIKHDGVIAKEAALAQALLQAPSSCKSFDKKRFIGVATGHNFALSQEDVTHIANTIEELLQVS